MSTEALMKRHRNRKGEWQVLRELDRLVWDELQALDPADTKKQGGGSKEGVTARKEIPQQKVTAADVEPASSPPGVESDPDEEPAVEKPIVKRVVKPAERGGDRHANIGDVDSEYPPAHASLLDREEEEFVAGVVDWLRGRLNPDEIIATIWSRVTEAEPKAFYEPERPGTELPPEAATPSDRLAGAAQSSIDRG
jgi:hypothetical protein